MSNRDRVSKLKRLGALATDATGELYVLRHDGDAFGVYRAQIRIFEETDQVRLASLLEGHHGGALEPQVGLEVLRYLANESLKWQLTNQQLRALLIATDLAKGDSSRPVAVRLLHAAGGGALCGRPSSRAVYVAPYRRSIYEPSASCGP
ncbi:hypothetical protein EVAR_3145_1 [Eumeta japonica]|uniref:Uncharacterized protein n=1 Tax=Eumeta variegata TaxID=151549 RepID=A0A4C1XH00_EUMVA|nr:hypothetical protein EVAR_3145_1 [Eumeta japonica]